MTPLFFADPTQFDASFLKRLLPLLPPKKQEALQSLKNERARKESLLGWGLLAFAWHEAFLDQPMPAVSFSQSGKPFFENSVLCFSLSHTDTVACLALSECGPVGADAQTLKEPSNALVRRVLTKAEQAVLDAAADKALLFTRLWTMKEALVKQTGEGLSRSFGSLDFAPFAEKNSFFAFGLEFAVETRLDAVITRCAERLLPGPAVEIEQRQMEKVLFCEKNG